MGEVNKRHNRKVRRPCPVCGGRVKVASDGGYWWWMYCSVDRKHFPQIFYHSAQSVLNAWENPEEPKEGNE